MFSRFLPRISRPLFLLSGVFLGSNLYEYRQKSAQCCGIIAVLTNHHNAQEICLEGLQILSHRGYDSAGVATIDSEKNVSVTKFANDLAKKEDSIQKLKKLVPENHKNGVFGMGHTRWATCGSKTDKNAHPHTDYKGRILLVHNGTVDNYEQMRQGLEEKKIPIVTETDSELIAHYIGLCLDEGLTLLQATQKALADNISGTWALVVVDKSNPEVMIASRNGSVMLIGLNPEAIFVGSDKTVFSKYTSNYLPLKDGEIIELDLKKRAEFYKASMNRKNTLKSIGPEIEIPSHPRPPYKYFFEQEMFEQPEALLKTLGYGSRLSHEMEDCCTLGGLESRMKDIVNIENLVLCGEGSSYWAASFVVKFFRMLEIFNTVSVAQASDANDTDLPKDNAGAIFVSQSGETGIVFKLLQMARGLGLFTIGCVNGVGSLIASKVDCGVYLHCGREFAIPATKSFVSQVCALVMIAIWMSQRKGHAHKKMLRMELKNSLRQLPVFFGEVLHSIGPKVKTVANIYVNESYLMVLGKGASGSIAKEGALKLKTTGFLQAEAFSSGEMKHGPIALIQPEVEGATKVLLIILDDEYFHDMELALSEVKSRRAHTTVITDCYYKLTKNKIDEYIEIPSVQYLTPLLCVIPFQMLAYELTLLKNDNPDKPRNIAKVYQY